MMSDNDCSFPQRRNRHVSKCFFQRFDHIIKPNYAKHILAAEYKIKYKYNHKYLGYEFSSIIFEKSTRNQVTGYELTSRMWLRVDFLGTG